jgi:hypothetical protein
MHDLLIPYSSGVKYRSCVLVPLLGDFLLYNVLRMGELCCGDSTMYFTWGKCVVLF